MTNPPLPRVPRPGLVSTRLPRSQIEPALGQCWKAENGQSRTIVTLWPATNYTEAAVRLRQDNGSMIVASYASFRTWVSRVRAVLEAGNE